MDGKPAMDLHTTQRKVSLLILLCKRSGVGERRRIRRAYYSSYYITLIIVQKYIFTNHCCGNYQTEC